MENSTGNAIGTFPANEKYYNTAIAALPYVPSFTYNLASVEERRNKKTLQFLSETFFEPRISFTNSKADFLPPSLGADYHKTGHSDF